ncbi:hypothetical protein [Sphingomonas sp. CLY1604]|uniref:hypothetical protein n=1 Tax=Sphingomonas sp. CLY1604 TaxID=3457786 RepID=UPI003FD805F5
MAVMRALKEHRYLFQACLIASTTTMCELITDAVNFRSLFNSIWLLGLPALCGIVANVGWDRRCFIALTLTGISLVVAMFVGVNFTSYS